MRTVRCSYSVCSWCRGMGLRLGRGHIGGQRVDVCVFPRRQPGTRALRFPVPRAAGQRVSRTGAFPRGGSRAAASGGEPSGRVGKNDITGEELDSALAGAGHRVAQVIGLAFADLILFESRGDDSRLAIPLRDGEEQVGTLVVPANLSRRQQERVHRMTPSLEALVVATRDRLKINAEVSALGSGRPRCAGSPHWSHAGRRRTTYTPWQ